MYYIIEFINCHIRNRIERMNHQDISHHILILVIKLLSYRVFKSS